MQPPFNRLSYTETYLYRVSLVSKMMNNINNNDDDDNDNKYKQQQ
jgi:hypothetical protein